MLVFMDRKYKLIIQIFICFIFVNAFIIGSSATDFPPGKLYFSPANDLEANMLGFISSAKGHIYLFTEKLDSAVIVDELIRKFGLQHIPVRIIIPAVVADHVLIKKLRDARIEVVTAGGSSGFKGTFIEIDNQQVLMTPHDISYSSLHSNNNYIFIVDSHLLCDNFILEFNEMYLPGYYGTTSPTNITHPKIEVSPAVIETFFLPENDISPRMTQLIDSAKTGIYIMTETFNSQIIAEKLSAKIKSKVDVKIILYNLSSSEMDVYEYLKFNGIDTLEKKFSVEQTKQLMNFAVIDNRYLIILPGNYFAGVASTNDSYGLVIDSTTSSSSFMIEFNRIFSKITQGITLRGRVRNKITNKVIPNAKLTVRNSGSLSYSSDFSVIPDSGVISYTDKYGIYNFKNLGTSSILLNVEKENFFSIEKIMNLTDSLQEQDFEMNTIENSGTLRGKIVNSSNNQGVAEVDVYAEYVEEGSGIVTQASARTGPDGWFMILNVPVGQVRVRAIIDSFLPSTPEYFTILNNQKTEIDHAIPIIPKYQITAIPNPIFPDNLFITINSYTNLNTIPQVEITQKDYIPITVSMRFASSATDKYTLFSGTYRIKNGYWGETIIDVNSGEERKTFNIGFIEAGSRYTFYAPSNSRLELENISASSGIISAFPANKINTNNEFSDSNLTGINFSGPINTDFAKGSKIVFKNSTDGYHLYKLEGDNNFTLLETTKTSEELSAEFQGFSSYYILKDIKKPIIENHGSFLILEDKGSGIDENSISIRKNEEDIKFLLRKDTNRLILTLRDIKNIDNCTISLNDRALNSITKTISFAAAGNKTGSLSVFPNPIRNNNNSIIRIQTITATTMKIKIRDSAGRVVYTDKNDLNATLHTFNWNIRNKLGKLVSNGTYFVSAYDINNNIIDNGKIVILK